MIESGRVVLSAGFGKELLSREGLEPRLVVPAGALPQPRLLVLLAYIALDRGDGLELVFRVLEFPPQTPVLGLDVREPLVDGRLFGTLCAVRGGAQAEIFLLSNGKAALSKLICTKGDC